MLAPMVVPPMTLATVKNSELMAGPSAVVY